MEVEVVDEVPSRAYNLVITVDKGPLPVEPEAIDAVVTNTAWEHVKPVAQLELGNFLAWDAQILDRADDPRGPYTVRIVVSPMMPGD